MPCLSFANDLPGSRGPASMYRIPKRYTEATTSAWLAVRMQVPPVVHHVPKGAMPCEQRGAPEVMIHMAFKLFLGEIAI